uniref:Uncharacterized protein n=1 Tax=Onchocerca volvulus TaxID=6282 RepID=A0A8R1TWC3_ONCVO
MYLWVMKIQDEIDFTGTTLAVTSSIKNGDDDGNLLTTTKFHSSVRCLLALLSTCYMLVHLLLIVASLILIASFYLLKSYIFLNCAR